jgi:hypothetical protein
MTKRFKLTVDLKELCFELDQHPAIEGKKAFEAKKETVKETTPDTLAAKEGP